MQMMHMVYELLQRQPACISFSVSFASLHEIIPLLEHVQNLDAHVVKIIHFDPHEQTWLCGCYIRGEAT